MKLPKSRKFLLSAGLSLVALVIIIGAVFYFAQPKGAPGEEGQTTEQPTGSSGADSKEEILKKADQTREKAESAWLKQDYEVAVASFKEAADAYKQAGGGPKEAEAREMQRLAEDAVSRQKLLKQSGGIIDIEVPAQ